LKMGTIWLKWYKQKMNKFFTFCLFFKTVRHL
jgi:hypothetical protein